jgi:hypothetical protein
LSTPPLKLLEAAQPSAEDNRVLLFEHLLNGGWRISEFIIALEYKVAPQQIVIPNPPLHKVFERMRETPTVLG